MSSRTVAVNLLGKNYRIKCPEEAVDLLEEATQLLTQRMRHIKQRGPQDPLSIAVIAALNLTSELLEYKRNVQKVGASLETDHTFDDLHHKVMVALDKLPEEEAC